MLTKDIAKIIGQDLTGRAKERWNLYRERWDASNRFEYIPVDFPMQVTVETQPSYNCKCVMYPHSYPPDRQREYMDKTKILPLYIIKSIIDDGGENLYSFIPHGIEEPLLNPELFEIIHYARGIPDIWLSSNGRLLTVDMARRIAESGVTRFEVSLDALTQETYEKIRSPKYPLSKVENAVINFITVRGDRKFPKIRVSFCRTPYNIHEGENFVKQWESIVDYIAIQDCVLFDVRNPFPVESIKAIDPDTYKCPLPMQQVMVRSNGMVTPCCGPYMHDIVMGNVHEQSLGEVWQSKRFKEFRQDHLDGKYRKYKACSMCVDGTVKW